MSRRFGFINGQAEPLTARETEILRLIAEGTSSRNIATRLGIRYATVRSHIRSIDGKLDVHSKGEAATKARKLGLIS